MLMPAILFGAALLISAVGFKKYVWFISLGYGYSVMGIGIVLLSVLWYRLTIGSAILCGLLVIYGCRLGTYLLIREIKSKAYNDKMKKEIKSGKDMKIFVKCMIWVTAALLYVCQTCPALFRLENPFASDDVFLIVGVSLGVLGFITECVADFQKSQAKKKNPKRFVDTGLYRIVRCPNYFGELLLWTGVFVSGISCYATVLQWVLSILGYLGIVYVMFSGARRLEERQTRTYGKDPEYIAYFKKTPIMIPLIPLYSVVKAKWLVG